MRRKLFITVLFPLVASLCALWGFLIEPNRLVINHYELKLKKWSPQLNGLKIIALSDIHAGSNFINEKKLQQIVSEVNAQNPDIVVLLGDYVSFNLFDNRNLKMPLKTIAGNLSGFRAKYGVFAVLGNTDEEFNKREVSYEFEKVGIKVLSEETINISINEKQLCLLGMRDKMLSANWHEISNELKIILAKENTDNIIVLVHNPDYLPVITGDFSISNNVSLILAGHTHGGQCRFPVIGAPIVPSEYGQKYVGGYVRDQEMDMFVTTGIGTSKIPVRFGVPPEIAVLTLYAE